MKITADDLKRHYESLSDDELLSMSTADLSDAARQCYDGELARRSLRPAPPPVDESASGEAAAPAEAREDLVPVAAFLSREQLRTAQSILESAEIPTYLPDEQTVRVYGVLRGGRLLVPASYLDQARDLLQLEIADANKAAVEQWLGDEWLASAVPGLADAGANIDDMLAERDKVAARLTIDGSHAGKQVQLGAIVIARVDCGSVVESWSKLDPLPSALSS